MRYNERELVQFSQTQANWEGKLKHKPPKSKNASKSLVAGILGGSGSDDDRDRWFKLRANCLFYFRLSQNGGRPPLGAEPLGCLILERFHVQTEGFEAQNAFSIIFADDGGDKKHYFVAENDRHAKQWINALKLSSYQELRSRLVNLQIVIREKTNCDPLNGTAFQNNPLFCPTATETSQFALADAGGDPPKPKPRKPKKDRNTFKSHVMENWESHSPHKLNNEDESDRAIEAKPTFQSHVPTGNLINF